MTGFSKHVVVENIAANLAERRRMALGRRSAYMALCTAILCDAADEPVDASVPERHPAAIRSAGLSSPAA